MDRDQIVKLRRQGYQYKEIADKLDISFDTIYRYLKNAGLIKERLTEHDKHLVKELYFNEGLSQHEIAKKFDVSQMTISHICKQYLKTSYGRLGETSKQIVKRLRRYRTVAQIKTLTGYSKSTVLRYSK